MNKMSESSAGQHRFGNGWGSALLGALIVNLVLLLVITILLHQNGARRTFPEYDVAYKINLKTPTTEAEVAINDVYDQAPELYRPDLKTALNPPAFPMINAPPLPPVEFDVKLSPAPKLEAKKEIKKKSPKRAVEKPLPSSKASTGSPAQVSSYKPGADKKYYKETELKIKPSVINRPEPNYPLLAVRRNIEGWVKVRFLVDSKGRVEKVSLLASEPGGVFDKSVLKTVPTWTFKPGEIDGRPVDAWVVTTILFELKK